MFPPRLIPAIQMWEFDPQNRRLYLIHAPVGAHDLMLITDTRTVVPYHAHPLRQVRIVRDADARFAVCSQGLAALQAEAAYVTDAADRSSLIGSAVCL